MPKYLVTHHGGGPMPTDPEIAQQVMQAFQSRAAGVGSALLDPGAPLSQSMTVSSDGTRAGQSFAEVGGPSPPAERGAFQERRSRPLLIVGLGEDHTSLRRCRRSSTRGTRSPRRRPTSSSLDGRPHLGMAGEGWEEIASGIDDWLQRTLEKVPAGAATET